MSFFALVGPLDLFRKMEADLAALIESPSDSRLAFNFFVTAEHLPDWLDERVLVRKHALLRVVSHLASGALSTSHLIRSVIRSSAERQRRRTLMTMSNPGMSRTGWSCISAPQKQPSLAFIPPMFGNLASRF
jgi:hypothetical protein